MIVMIARGGWGKMKDQAWSALMSLLSSFQKQKLMPVPLLKHVETKFGTHYEN